MFIPEHFLEKIRINILLCRNTIFLLDMSRPLYIFFMYLRLLSIWNFSNKFRIMSRLTPKQNITATFVFYWFLMYFNDVCFAATTNTHRPTIIPENWTRGNAPFFLWLSWSHGLFYCSELFRLWTVPIEILRPRLHSHYKMFFSDNFAYLWWTENNVLV